MNCPHNVIDHDSDTEEYYCVKCGDVISDPGRWE